MIDKFISAPIQKFLKIESLSGILLFSATLFALIWANSPFSYMYDSLWNYKIGITSTDFELAKPLILWVNDGLMAIFFFLIGLELKRELLIGELNSVKKAAFPFLAAIGGMIIPVVLFLTLNKNPETSDGWGIPMAADIAFALAIVQLLGKRVPIGLKVFLIAFAIIDDIGAVMVIAIFYSASINWMLLGYALIILLILGYLSYKKLYSNYFVIFGVITWFLFLKSGIHPTIAGVLLAFTIPIRQKMAMKTYVNKLCDAAANIKVIDDDKSPILTNEQLDEIDSLESYTEKVQSPLQHLEHKLHGWVAYFIMPIFALANAGVTFSSKMNFDYSLISTVAISLVIGNFIGVTVISYLGLKLKITVLPDGVLFKHIIGMGFIAGVGFTMSIFIANLAYVGNPTVMASAKVGILIGSLIAGFTGYFILKLIGKE